MEHTPPKQSTFKRNAHLNYFLRCLRALPTDAQGHDGNRITIAYFCLSGLDILGALEDKTTREQRSGWIEWIWALQAPEGGFRGSTYLTTANPATSPPHLPSTYTALLCLAILRAPLDRLNVLGLAAFLRSCQGEDGSFSPLPRADRYASAGFQNDVRMSYCASVVCDVAGCGADVDREAAIGFVRRCRTWEGGYAARPGVVESQGGTTYCAIASLSLLNGWRDAAASAPPSLSPDGCDDDTAATLRWLLQRQVGGFQGRPGKLEDVCYSFWCGGAVSILDHADLINTSENLSFLLSAQFLLGGFGKEPEDYPDPFHSYLALAALALSSAIADDLGLKPLDPRCNVSLQTAKWLSEEMGRVKSAQ